MKVIDPYTVVNLQTTPPLCLTNDDIRKSIKYIAGMMNWAVRSGFELSFGVKPEDHRFAPVKFITIPEFGIATFSGAKEKNVDFVLSNGLAVQIPGPETDILAEKAKELNVFIAAVLYEYDPEWPDRYFNTAFLINPQGEVILKHRKIYIPAAMSVDVSPHDFYDEYVAKYGDGPEVFYPVAKTEIGNIGFAICTEGWFPETFRALAMNGAEIVLHPNFHEPLYSPPVNHYEILNRAAAINNIMYVIGNAVGSASVKRTDVPGYENPARPDIYCPGHSMVVDYYGAIIGSAPYPGEAACWGIIRINELRKRRQDPWNYPAMLRTETFRKIYDKTIYPPNLYTKNPWKDVSEVIKRAPLETIKEFTEKGIYTKPE